MKIKILQILGIIWIILFIAFQIGYSYSNKQCKALGGSIIDRGQFLNHDFECVKTEIIK